MKKIRWDFYLHFLQDVFFHADKYENAEARKKILIEMKAAIKKNTSSTKEDLAMYYDYLAADSGNPLRAIALSEKAVKTLPANTDKILLKINIYQNMFIHLLEAENIKEALEWSNRVSWLCEAYPEYRDHNWFVFQINQGVLLIALNQPLFAMKNYDDCRQYLIEAGMEGTQDYAWLLERIAQIEYAFGRNDLGERELKESAKIYERLYKNDPVRVEENKGRLQKMKTVLEEYSRNRQRRLASSKNER